ncbi:unnamed protein product [Brassica rapa subsp. trilocularis]
MHEIFSFTCIVFDKPNVVGVLRYRLGLSVSDPTDDTVFVAFDMEMTFRQLKLRSFWGQV